MAEGGRDITRNLEYLPDNLISAFENLGINVRVDENNLVRSKDIIGRGRESIVIDGHRQEECAVKYINLCTGDRRECQFYVRVGRECTILKELAHPHIVRIHEIFREQLNNGSDTRVAIFMEKCKCDLKTFMVEKKKPFSEARAKEIAWQIMSAVRYLHEKNWYHGDIKLSNVLFTFDHVAKLTDFGYAQRFNVYERKSSKRPPEEQERQLPMSQLPAGTPGHMAPEVIKAPEKPYSCPENDMFQLGVFIHDLLFYPPTFGKPGTKLTMDQYYTLAINERYNMSRSIAISKEAEDVIRALLRKNPADRPTIHELQKMPWFKNMPRIRNFQGSIERPTEVTLSPPKALKKSGSQRLVLAGEAKTFKVSKMPAFITDSLVTNERKRSQSTQSQSQGPSRSQHNTPRKTQGTTSRDVPPERSNNNRPQSSSSNHSEQDRRCSEPTHSPQYTIPRIRTRINSTDKSSNNEPTSAVNVNTGRNTVTPTATSPSIPTVDLVEKSPTPSVNQNEQSRGVADTSTMVVQTVNQQEQSSSAGITNDDQEKRKHVRELSNVCLKIPWNSDKRDRPVDPRTKPSDQPTAAFDYLRTQMTVPGPSDPRLRRYSISNSPAITSPTDTTVDQVRVVERLPGERDDIYKMRQQWIPLMREDWDHEKWARKAMQKPGTPPYPDMSSDSSVEDDLIPRNTVRNEEPMDHTESVSNVLQREGIELSNEDRLDLANRVNNLAQSLPVNPADKRANPSPQGSQEARTKTIRRE